MTRLGLIGGGRIARSVIAAVLADQAGPWQICSVLVQRAGQRRAFDVPFVFGIDSFIATKPDLIVELAGPQALREHGVRALEAADVWSISGMALADAEFTRSLEDAGRRSRHRLRLVTGAICGLDGLATASVDPAADIGITIATATGTDGQQPQFVGSARQVLQQFPGVNVIAAAAMASRGLDGTPIRYFPPVPGTRRKFEIAAESRYGKFFASASPVTTKEEGTITVSASIIAALRSAQEIIWAG